MRKHPFLTLVLALFVSASLWPGVAGAQEQPKKKFKVAFALLWTTDDMGWTTASYDGIQYLKEQLGDQIDVSYTEKVGAADAERVFRNYAKEGNDMIFGTTFEHMDPELMVAKDFPKIAFEQCSGYKTGPNMGTYFARMEQAEFLAGYMAGLMGYKNVGTVATNPIPEPIRGINAFTIGLIKGLKEKGVKFDEKKVNTVVWLKAWRDPINETTLAETLAMRGHDLIRQMADTPDSSIAACAKGVPAIGYGTDAAKAGAQCALVSTMWNWGPYYVKSIKARMAGTWKPSEYYGGFKEGDIKLSAFGSTVPKDVQDKVNAQKKLLEEGKDTIFAGPLYDQDGKLVIPAGKTASDKDLLTMRWLVQGVSGKLPE